MRQIRSLMIATATWTDKDAGGVPGAPVASRARPGDWAGRVPAPAEAPRAEDLPHAGGDDRGASGATGSTRVA